MNLLYKATLLQENQITKRVVKCSIEFKSIPILKKSFAKYILVSPLFYFPFVVLLSFFLSSPPPPFLCAMLKNNKALLSEIKTLLILTTRKLIMTGAPSSLVNSGVPQVLISTSFIPCMPLFMSLFY